MRLRWWILLALLPVAGESATIRSFDCEKMGTHAARCRIQIDGKIEKSDSLFLSHVNDVDTLRFGETKLGATGYLAGRRYYARFLPRVYSLEAIAGADSPLLTLDVESLLGPGAGLPPGAKVKVISSGYPLYKVLGPLALRVLQVGLLFALAASLFGWIRVKATDGWSYPAHETFWFHSGLILFLFSMTELPRVFVPSWISGERFFFLQAIASSIAMWSLAILLLESRFTSRSSIERSFVPTPPAAVRLGIHGAFLAALLLLSGKFGGGYKSSHSLALFIQTLALAFAAPGVWLRTEWRRAWKRSSVVSLLHHFSLAWLAVCFAYASIRYHFFQISNTPMVEVSGYLTLFLAAWRVDRFKRAVQLSREFTEYCRARLSTLATGEERIRALADLIQDETSAARVSLISVQDGEGLVLASSGPDAIPFKHRKDPRPLGPFLKRVCRERHILYAPVAEELGRALIDKGLKHSSLAIPVTQGHEVRAVLCVMANEDERIPPFDAAVMELSAHSLSLEILSAVAQSLSEEKATQLRSITRIASGLALEHMDSWGRLAAPNGKEKRFIVSADCVASTSIGEQASRSPLLENMYQRYKTELYAVWFALRQSFEFLSKDVRGDDFWAVSPKRFQNPALTGIGEEKAALLLAHLLEKHARHLSLRDEYRALGLFGARVAVSAVDLRLLALGTPDAQCIDIDSPDMARLQRIRASAQPGEILVRVDGGSFAAALSQPDPIRLHGVRRVPVGSSEMPGLLDFPEILAMLAITTERKELRRLENGALEIARETVARRRAA